MRVRRERHRDHAFERARREREEERQVRNARKRFLRDNPRLHLSACDDPCLDELAKDRLSRAHDYGTLFALFQSEKGREPIDLDAFSYECADEQSTIDDDVCLWNALTGAFFLGAAQDARVRSPGSAPHQLALRWEARGIQFLARAFLEWSAKDRNEYLDWACSPEAEQPHLYLRAASVAGAIENALMQKLAVHLPRHTNSVGTEVDFYALTPRKDVAYCVRVVSAEDVTRRPGPLPRELESHVRSINATLRTHWRIWIVQAEPFFIEIAAGKVA